MSPTPTGTAETPLSPASLGDDRVCHLYVHLPFCAHRCGYCDFVTVVGRRGGHGEYVDALLAELELERGLLAPALETVFLGGGTPTYLEQPGLDRLLRALPRAAEVTAEANPESLTPPVARMLREAGVTRISLGAQSFQAHLLATLERRVAPDDVRRAFYHLRDACFDNISLDLLYGIPGQSPSDLEADIDEAVRLGPEHLSCYELEAKPGTRFTHAYGEELVRQAEAMERYLELVVGSLEAAGYRWYETSSFCRGDRRARHNLAYWLGRDYLGLGIGAVSTVGVQRWRNRPQLPGYVTALGGATAAGVERAEGKLARPGAGPKRPPREYEPLTSAIRERERLMLGLRLDEPVPHREVAGALDPAGVERMIGLGLLRVDGRGLGLTPRGRRLGGAVTAEILADARSQGEPALVG